MLLASAFHSNGNMEEHCAATALAVWGMAKKNAQMLDESDDEFIGDPVSEETLLFPGITFVEETEISSLTHGLSVMINKLARASIETLKASQSVRCNIPHRNTILAMLLENATDEFEKFSISKLLDSMIWIGKFNITQTLALIRELLRCSSKVLKSHICSEHDAESGRIFSLMSQELNNFLDLQLDRLAGILPSQDLQIISSALRVSFAMSLVDPTRLCFPKSHSYLCTNDIGTGDIQRNILRLSIDQMGLSDELFVDGLKDQDNLDASFFVQWAAVRFHKTIFLEHEHISNSPSGLADSSDGAMQQYTEVVSITT